MVQTVQPPRKRNDDLLFPPLIPAPVPVYGGPGLPPASGGAVLLPSMQGPAYPVPLSRPAAIAVPDAGGGAPGRTFYMRGPQPVPPTALPAGAAPRMLPPAGGSGGGGGAGAGAAAAGGAAMAASRAAMPSAINVARGGAILGASMLAGQGALDAANDPSSRLRDRIAKGAGEMALARREGASEGRKAGILVRNAAAGGGEAVLAGAKGLLNAFYPGDFIAGLVGDGGAAPTPVAPPVEARAQLVRQFTGGSPTAAANSALPVQGRGAELTFNQLIPLLQAMPRISRQAPSWEDQVGGQLNELFAMQRQAIEETPGLTDAQRSRQLDALRNQLLAAVAKNSLPLMPEDDE